MKYLIHAIPGRIKYVNNHLIPSMISQGIKEEEILVYEDAAADGNLTSTLKSIFFNIPDNYECTWHLQDDVIISSNFAVETRRYDLPLDYSVVCGFCSIYDKEKAGEVYPKDMWYSFQCIKINNELAHEFARWVIKQWNDSEGKYWLQISNNKYDDYLFKSFMESEHPDMEVYNLAPNIVDHIDYLIGGSSLCDRKELMKSKYFKEPKLIEDLKKELR